MFLFAITSRHSFFIHLLCSVRKWFSVFFFFCFFILCFFLRKSVSILNLTGVSSTILKKIVGVFNASFRLLEPERFIETLLESACRSKRLNLISFDMYRYSFKPFDRHSNTDTCYVIVYLRLCALPNIT